MQIEIPESVKFYYENDANENAINELVTLNSRQNKRLSGFTLNELDRSNQARLAAMKTQIDLWNLMVEIWDNTWGIAIKEFQLGKEIEASGYDDIRDFNHTWDEAFYKKYNNIEDGYLILSVDITSESVVLYFYYSDNSKKRDKYEITNRIELAEKIWEQKPIDDERKTVEKLIPVRGKSSISLDILQGEARYVIQKIKEIFG